MASESSIFDKLEHDASEILAKDHTASSLPMATLLALKKELLLFHRKCVEFSKSHPSGLDPAAKARLTGFSGISNQKLRISHDFWF